MTRPTAAPARWPYLDHRTVAQLDELQRCSVCAEKRTRPCGFARCGVAAVEVAA